MAQRRGFHPVRSQKRKLSWEEGPGQNAIQTPFTGTASLLVNAGQIFASDGFTLVRLRGALTMYLSTITTALDGFTGAFGILGVVVFAPGVLVAGLAFLTYSFGRKAGFGWAAALFVSLVPTSVRILGPAFVVPVTAAMLFILVTLIFLHNLEEKNREKSLWILTLVMAAAIFLRSAM